MAETYTFVADPDTKECNALVLQHHYSQRLPVTVTYRSGLVDDSGRLVAAVMFSVPPTRWSKPVRELSRLVRVPGVKPPLTMLISKACKELQRRKLADLVVSFADATQRHHGGVYQAASWAYHEHRAPRNDGFLIDGEFVPGRTCYHRFGTSSRKVVADICEVWGMTFEEHWDAGKHLYWRALTRTGQQWAAELGLQSLPYFKDIA